MLHYIIFTDEFVVCVCVNFPSDIGQLRPTPCPRASLVKYGIYVVREHLCFAGGRHSIIAKWSISARYYDIHQSGNDE